MIYDLIDLAFRVFMWALLDPLGRSLFTTLSAICGLGCLAYLIYDFRRGDDVEN